MKRLATTAAVATIAFACGWLVSAPAHHAAPGRVQPVIAEDEPAVVGKPEATEARGAPVRAASPPGASTAAPVQLTPGAAGYDGEAAAIWLELTPTQLFEREPRDEVWAAEMERTIERLMAERMASVGLELTVVDVDCRTSTCRTRFDVSTRDQRDALTLLSSGLVPVGSTRSYDVVDTAGDRAEVDLVSTFAGRIRSVSDYERWFAERQASQAADLGRWRERWLARRGAP